MQKVNETLSAHGDMIERDRASIFERIHSWGNSYQQKLQAFREQIDAGLAVQQENLTKLATSFEESLVRVENDLRAAMETKLGAAMVAKLAAEEEAKRHEGTLVRLDANAVRLEADVVRLEAEIASLREDMQVIFKQVQQASFQQRSRERDMRRLAHAIEQGSLELATIQHPHSAASPVPPMFPSEIKNEAQFDYFLFQERYRGDEADIRERQHAYLEYFRGRENVVDLGCGRGEFLDLLRDNEISCRGVEQGTDQYLLCKEKGLDVVQQDLFAFLESCPDESLGGIFSAQVIEHMMASDQLRYVALAYRKTKPGSPVIFETINPQCVFALVRNFFLDPTHVRPIHPETLQFAMESMKFRNVELRFSGPVGDHMIPPLPLEASSAGLEQFNSAIRRLNDLLYGYQDYAAIGWK